MNKFRVAGFNLLAKRWDLTVPNHCISSHIFTGRISSYLSLHTSSISLQTSKQNESTPVERKYKKPVDWLPFRWQRRPMFNIFKQSGDTIQENTIDPSLPRPDFELSDELKTANEDVKHFFSLATGRKGDMKEVCRRHLLKKVQRHPHDFSSLEVKIALMTITVRGLFEHHKVRAKYEVRNSRISLPIIIQKRNELLKQLRKIDEDRFQWILNELKLYYNPSPLSVKLEKYCKKWDLRRLTKEYCEKQIARKKAEYHEELKKEQEQFLEEKKQILAWIEEEEKAIKALNV